MERTVNVSVTQKVLSVILGTLLGGFMWRCRGEGGFGSSWGLYSVALVILLLIWTVYGKKTKMKFEMIPFGAFLMGLGVTGYGTIMDQMMGYCWSDLPYQGQDTHISVAASHAILIFFLMGFTFVPMFSFFAGSLFSKRQYKAQHYIIMIALFFGVSYIFKASLAHFILKVINPETVNCAQLGLIDSGYDYSSPMAAYMAHFGQRKWSQTIPFFENYFMCIEHVSDAAGVISLVVYAGVFLKDKITAAATFIISFVTGLGTTLFNILLYASMSQESFIAKYDLPSFLSNISGWGIWEYSTGASVGFITMLFIALIPRKYTEQTECDNEPFFRNKIVSFAFNTVCSIFILALTPFRAIGIRTGRLLENLGICSDSPSGDIIMIVGTVFLGAFFIYKFVCNILKNDKTPFGLSSVEFTNIALPSYFIMCAVAYFALDKAVAFNLPISEIKETSFFNVMFSQSWFEFTLMVITLICVIVLYFLLKKSLKKNEA